MPRRAKENDRGVNWLNWFIGGALTFLVVAAAALFGSLEWAKSYLNGEEFQEIVSGATSRFFKAKGSFEEILWTGSSAYSDGYAARGYADAPFSRITANGIRANVDFGAARDGRWKVDSIGMNRLVLLVNEGDRLAGMAADTASGPDAVEPPAFLAALLPREVRVDEISITDANLVTEREDGGRVSLAGVEARLRPIEGSKAWSVSGRSGKLTIPDLPELEIDSFATRLKGSELFITDSAFTLLDGARLTGSGEMKFGKDGNVALQLRIADLDADEVVGPKWRDKVDGIMHGDGTVDRVEGGALRKAGTMHVNKGVLEGLEILEQVADYAKAERFRRLVLHEAKADFEQVGDRLEVTNLVLQSDGLTRLTGKVVFENGRIEGNFRVGVTPGTLKWIPGAEQTVFVEPEGGFLWTDMRVAGPADNPSEDLSGRLKVAAVKAVVEGAVNGVLGVAPGGAVKAGKTAVDVGADAGKGAIDAAAEGGKMLLDTLTPFFK